MGLGRARLALVALALVLVLVSGANAASQPLLTTSMTAGTAVQATFAGIPVIKVNYTDTISGYTVFFVWLTVQNSVGQTVGISHATENMTAGQTTLAVLALTGLAAGHYTGHIFVVTSSKVAVSATTTVSITL